MPTLAATAADLLPNPRPVLCLDTCELLMAVQCLPQRRVIHIEALARIHTFLAANPDHLRVVITDLVPHEWGQNIAEVQQKAGHFSTRPTRTARWSTGPGRTWAGRWAVHPLPTRRRRLSTT